MCAEAQQKSKWTWLHSTAALTHIQTGAPLFWNISALHYRHADCPAAQALTVCPAQAETGRLQSSSTSWTRQRHSGTSQVSSAVTSGPLGESFRFTSSLLWWCSVICQYIWIPSCHMHHINNRLWVTNRACVCIYASGQIWNVTLS